MHAHTGRIDALVHRVPDALFTLQRVALAIVSRAVDEEYVPAGKSGPSTGGYLCVAHADTGLPIIVLQLGELPDAERAQRFLEVCQEKAQRLAEYALSNGHTTSRESRDPDNGKYAAAFLLQHESARVILSFSGFPEMHDEGLVLAIALEAHLITEHEADVLAERVGHTIHEVFSV